MRMIYFLRPHAVSMLMSLGAGVASAYEFGRGYGGLWWVPFLIASALGLRQLLSNDDLSPLYSARLFSEKLALAYLAFGIGFAAFWLAR